RGARRAAGAAGGALRRPLRARPAAPAAHGGRQARRALRARGADRRARGRAGRRLHPRPPASARAAPVRAVPRRGGPRRAGALPRVIQLPIRRLRPDAALPARAYSGDAGFDLAACERVELGPGERAMVPTGLAVAIPEGYAGFVQPRSGLAARNGVTIVNTPGIVDSGYRGELQVILLNTDRVRSFVVE